eukprot:COSAG01_NODE_2955_length_6799_cov_5.722090_4_plen_48_part_00
MHVTDLQEALLRDLALRQQLVERAVQPIRLLQRGLEASGKGAKRLSY